MKKVFLIRVSGYENGAAMPVRLATRAGGGENKSIGVSWKSAQGAQSYALLFYDLHPIARGWVHWLVTDIPASAMEITEGISRTSKMPAGAVELTTSWGKMGYDGPQPPIGSGSHEYAAVLYALDIPSLGLTGKDDAESFKKAIEGHVVAEERWSGRFER